MTEHTGTSVGGHELATDSRLLGLESRIEHVASATFTNLRWVYLFPGNTLAIISLVDGSI